MEGYPTQVAKVTNVIGIILCSLLQQQKNKSPNEKRLIIQFIGHLRPIRMLSESSLQVSLAVLR